MKRRLLLAAPLLLGGCSALTGAQPIEKRDWPLLVPRPVALPPRPHGRILLVRDFRAAPGLEQRGLQTLNADGSLNVDYYEQWAVPPAEGAEEALRQWLAASGLFAAVLAPGSRVSADLVLEGELLTLRAEPAHGVAVARIAYVLADERPETAKLLAQETLDGEAPLTGHDAPALANALRTALAIVLARVEMSLRGVV